jgi:hypothetical protein
MRVPVKSNSKLDADFVARRIYFAPLARWSRGTTNFNPD